jgi:hypothetical protein
MRVVVFTGGECFLLGTELDKLIEDASKRGLSTRCVTNGYWAGSEKSAAQRVARIKRSGLREINFSTGSYHAKYVPIENIIFGATACARTGITTLINVETFQDSDFDFDALCNNSDLVELVGQRRLRIQRSVWIENNGRSKICHLPENSRFRDEKISGCSTALNVLAVTPDQELIACCGLHLERIPELHIGSVANCTIQTAIDATPDDLLKQWIHVEGPERILKFVKKIDPTYELPVHCVHPCETCLHLYSDEKAKAIIKDNYAQEETRVFSLYMAGLLAKQFTPGLSDDESDQRAVDSQNDDQRVLLPILE